MGTVPCVMDTTGSHLGTCTATNTLIQCWADGDSDGFEQDAQRPHAYRWRDWVIAAVNRDMPFDQFTIEQLAGDLLPNATPQQLLAPSLSFDQPKLLVLCFGKLI